ncbi:MAG: hypothetical protein IKB11_04190, partial [Bacteroidaceae bacterium]|nr:hypothetical protein [Bacteroidaceae bacterium]
KNGLPFCAAKRVPDTPKTSATFSVKKATICAEFFGTFYRHRKYIKNIIKMREYPIINTENNKASPLKTIAERIYTKSMSAGARHSYL